MGLQREDWGSRQGDEICDIMCVCCLLVLPGRDVTQPGDRHYSQLVKTAHFLVLFLDPTTLRDKLDARLCISCAALTSSCKPTW